ncbi:hypothetical protein SADUNF_Sadunf17G0049000 [Salix dunnii]|uniref:Uncharacterized protein n=1 Tax=Salix dunnii TaxID=1413687 RepID=A0A835MN23_9ROSI|nr:hypothetical protein SADUNF_Sadunf17G0049000 [Salix dunnii]
MKEKTILVCCHTKQQTQKTTNNFVILHNKVTAIFQLYSSTFSMALDPMQCGIMVSISRCSHHVSMSMFRTFFSSAWKNRIFPGSMRYEARLMEAVHGVHRMNIVIRIRYGGSYGCPISRKNRKSCAGVCLEEKDMNNGLFVVSNLDEASTILLPQTPEKLRELMRLSFVKLARGVPSFFLTDIIDVTVNI